MEHRMSPAMAPYLHEEFQAIASYQEKIHFFDHHLGLLPFDPPPFDPTLSWLFDPSPVLNLLDLFLIEMDRRKNFFTKTIVYENQNFTFSIHPFSKNQRITLNQFILTKFLSGFAAWERQVNKQANPLSTSEQELQNANTTLARIREISLEKTEQTIHAKFIQVFLKGYLDKNIHEQVINRRKRFVELFLYAQGMLYAQYVELLQKRVSDFKTKQTGAPPLLTQKLKVMEKLGFFNFLKTMLDDERKAKNRLIKEIHFLLSDSKASPTNDENILIENFLFSKAKFTNKK